MFFLQLCYRHSTYPRNRKQHSKPLRKIIKQNTKNNPIHTLQHPPHLYSLAIPNKIAYFQPVKPIMWKKIQLFYHELDSSPPF